MTEDLKKLYDELYNEPSRNAKIFISTLERNIEIIEKSNSEEREEYTKVTKIIADYGSALYETGYTSKALLYLNNAIHRMENYNQLINVNLFEEPLYESSLFYRGMAKYNQRKYRESTSDFKKLVEKFPENDKYKGWYNGSIDHSLKTLDWTFLVALIVFIILLYFLKQKDGIIYYISFIGLLISLVISISLFIYKKTMKVK